MKYIFPLPYWFIKNEKATNTMVNECLHCNGYSHFKKTREGVCPNGPMDYLYHVGEIHGWFGVKTCKRCGERKKLKEFKYAGQRAGRTCNKCKNKRRWESKKKVFATDPDAHEREKQRRKKYKSYKDQNYYERNRDAIKKSTRRWKLANPDKVESYRNARKRGMESIDNKDLLKQIPTKRCYWCKCKLGDDFHYDHVVPISKGGRNIVANIVASCKSCNLSKHAKMPNDFIKEGQLILEMT